MTVELVNPESLHTPQSYTHVAAATGSRLVFAAGQAADDAEGNLVAKGDLAGQARQAFANVGRALAAAGARLSACGAPARLVETRSSATRAG